MTILSTSSDVAAFCADIADEPYITVDTEFLRDSTYWPILCLIQVSGTSQAVAIDPMANDIDLAPLWERMFDTDQVKVFHSARQDIEIIFNLTGSIPAPLFDTQVAAMVCGFGEAASYETLAAKLAGEQLDKSMRFTDWSKRPLNDRQLSYAISDVTHLRKVYDTLSEQLEKSGRTDWLTEEMAILTSPGTYATDPANAWKRIKTRNSNRKFLGVLQEIAAWREREAQTRNVPRNRILRDDGMSEIAAQRPATVNELKGLRGIGRSNLRSGSLEDVIEAVQRGVKKPAHEIPDIPKSGPGIPSTPSLNLLKVLLKIKCDEHGVAQKLVATADQVQAIAVDDNADVPALKGWRREIFGEDAIALKHGRIALTADGPNISLVRL